MSYSDSLRQQAAWVREALDPSTPATQRITLDDIDVEELEAAAGEIERLRRDIDAQDSMIASLAQEIERVRAALKEISELYSGSHGYRAKALAVGALNYPQD